LQHLAFAENIPDMLAGLLAVSVAEVRAAAVYALGALVFNAESVRGGSTLDPERSNPQKSEVRGSLNPGFVVMTIESLSMLSDLVHPHLNRSRGGNPTSA
jgi:hypothetical protein